MRLLSLGLFLVGLFAVTSFSEAQPPGQPGQPGKGGFGGGFAARSLPGQILSTRLQETLKLTDAQKKDLEALQKDVDTKLAKILSEDQQKQLKEIRDAGPGAGFGGFGGGGGGKGGFGKGGFPDGKGGKGGDGKGGDKKGDK